MCSKYLGYSRNRPTDEALYREPITLFLALISSKIVSIQYVYGVRVNFILRIRRIQFKLNNYFLFGPESPFSILTIGFSKQVGL